MEEQISRTLVTTEVTDFIRKCIASGEWKVGEKIPSETVLSKQLHVSRATLRIAIARFVTLKILHPEQGRGCFLISDAVDRLGTGLLPTKAYSDIRAVLEYRLLVEPQGLHWALLQGRTKVQALADELQVSLNIMRQSIGDPDAFIKADMDYHLAIARASGNEVLSDTLLSVFEKTAKSHHEMNDLFGFDSGLKAHERILKAIQERDDRRAERQLERHISSAIDQIARRPPVVED